MVSYITELHGSIHKYETYSAQLNGMAAPPITLNKDYWRKIRFRKLLVYFKSAKTTKQPRWGNNAVGQLSAGFVYPNALTDPFIMSVPATWNQLITQLPYMSREEMSQEYYSVLYLWEIFQGFQVLTGYFLVHIWIIATEEAHWWSENVAKYRHS